MLGNSDHRGYTPPVPRSSLYEKVRPHPCLPRIPGTWNVCDAVECREPGCEGVVTKVTLFFSFRGTPLTASISKGDDFIESYPGPGLCLDGL